MGGIDIPFVETPDMHFFVELALSKQLGQLFYLPVALRLVPAALLI
jgi:hypothetical protein